MTRAYRTLQALQLPEKQANVVLLSRTMLLYSEDTLTTSVCLFMTMTAAVPRPVCLATKSSKSIRARDKPPHPPNTDSASSASVQSPTWLLGQRLQELMRVKSSPFHAAHSSARSSRATRPRGALTS